MNMPPNYNPNLANDERNKDLNMLQQRPNPNAGADVSAPIGSKPPVATQGSGMPDIGALKAQVDSLQAQIAKLQGGGASAPTAPITSNPATSPAPDIQSFKGAPAEAPKTATNVITGGRMPNLLNTAMNAQKPRM